MDSQLPTMVTTAAADAVVRACADVTRELGGHHQEAYFALLAEGTQWELRVSGGPLRGTWLIDVPQYCRALPPSDRVLVVDEIFRRLRDEHHRAAATGALKPPSFARIA